MPGRIEKPSAAQLKGWRKLTLEKYRRQEGLFLAEGGKVVGELLRSGRPVAAVLVSGDGTDRRRDSGRAFRPGCRSMSSRTGNGRP